MIARRHGKREAEAQRVIRHIHAREQLQHHVHALAWLDIAKREIDDAVTIRFGQSG